MVGHQCTLRPVGGVLRPPVGVPISGIEDLSVHLDHFPFPCGDGFTRSDGRPTQLMTRIPHFFFRQYADRRLLRTPIAHADSYVARLPPTPAHACPGLPPPLPLPRASTPAIPSRRNSPDAEVIACRELAAGAGVNPLGQAWALARESPAPAGGGAGADRSLPRGPALAPGSILLARRTLPRARRCAGLQPLPRKRMPAADQLLPREPADAQSKPPLTWKQPAPPHGLE